MKPRTARREPINTAAHLETQEALPWLANGTLAGAELERAQSHLHGCAACRADLAMLHTLRAAGSGAEPHCDPDAAFARLLPHLGPQAAAAPIAPAVRWYQRLAANDRLWLRAVVGLQFCAILGLGAQLVGHVSPVPSQSEDYRVLGADRPLQARLVVVFKPDTPEREMRRIVNANGARIVGGPTVTDAYLLETSDNLATALARLRADSAVALAEPLVVEGRP